LKSQAEWDSDIKMDFQEVERGVIVKIDLAQDRE
jgi:hypothetical protein